MDIRASDFVQAMREDRTNGLEMQLFIAHRATTRAGDTTDTFDDWLEATTPGDMKRLVGEVDIAMVGEVDDADPT